VVARAELVGQYLQVPALHDRCDGRGDANHAELNVARDPAGHPGCLLKEDLRVNPLLREEPLLVSDPERSLARAHDSVDD